MSFAENRLDLGIDYGTVGGPKFSTSITVDGSGAEQRNANWRQPLGRWQLGERSLTQSELDYFLNFHALRKGAAIGFRFKDWTDYHALSQPIGIGDGITTQFQLAKTYSVGSYSVKRPILKPVGGTVKIYLNGAKQSSGWSVDITAGVITFITAPGSGVAIAADFEFDVPVRFEQDKIEFRFDAYEVGTGNAIFYLANLSVVEIRLPPIIAVPLTAAQPRLLETLNLGYDYGTVGGPAYNTTIATIGSGYEHRTSNWDDSRGRWQIGDRTLNRVELDYLIAFFRVFRGAASSFIYKDWASSRNVRVRFEQDTFEVRFDAYEPLGGEAIFYLAGLNVVEAHPILIVSRPVYVGFTAATGAAKASHDILYATVNGTVIIGDSEHEKRKLNGSAFYLQDFAVRLVPDIYDAAGSCFYKPQLNNLLSKLKIYFVFRIQGTEQDRSKLADGIACLITSASSGTSTLTQGGGLGYQGTKNALAIEYDIYRNSWDPNYNHIGVSINGQIETSPTVTPPIDIYGDVRHSWIEYDFSTKNLQVYLSSEYNKPSTPLISTSIDIEQILN
jgi:uncharacterized protein (TIGR02217 family)